MPSFLKRLLDLAAASALFLFSIRQLLLILEIGSEMKVAYIPRLPLNLKLDVVGGLELSLLDVPPRTKRPLGISHPWRSFFYQN